jgi:hypothetical protein
MLSHVLSPVMPRLDRGIQYARGLSALAQPSLDAGSPGPVYAKASTRLAVLGTPKL